MTQPRSVAPHLSGQRPFSSPLLFLAAGCSMMLPEKEQKKALAYCTHVVNAINAHACSQKKIIFKKATWKHMKTKTCKNLKHQSPVNIPGCLQLSCECPMPRLPVSAGTSNSPIPHSNGEGLNWYSLMVSCFKIHQSLHVLHLRPFCPI